MHAPKHPLPLILPPGTQVVLRVPLDRSGGRLAAGTLGVIVQPPRDGTHAYRVRFPDGSEAAVHRPELVVRRQYSDPPDEEGAESDEAALAPYVIYRCVVGSQAFGLDCQDSDTDRRGIYLPPAEMTWSLYGPPEQIEHEERQECFWELRKFLILALKANPNILECLYTPLVEHAAPLAQELLALREHFLSKLIYQTYNGYVMSQFKKLEQDLRNQGRIKWKHAMHLIRLLQSGITALRERRVCVHVGDERDLLLAIKRGERPWEEVNSLRLKLHADFDAAFAQSPLPERPNYELANAFLIRARRTMVE
jgi:predicted nucleotidyltransferase